MRVFIYITTTLLPFLLSSLSFVHGHLDMIEPPARGGYILHRTFGYPRDYDNTSPLYDPKFGGSFPCRHPQPGPISMKVMAGREITVKHGGWDHHLGGHCQYALSYDNGNSFIVIKTITGSCLVEGINQYQVLIPPNAPGAAHVVFAWGWINAEGNRQYYMNCADIRIIARPGSPQVLEGPELLVGNLAPVVRGPRFDEWPYYGTNGWYYFAQRDLLRVDATLVTRVVRRNGPWGRVALMALPPSPKPSIAPPPQVSTPTPSLGKVKKLVVKVVKKLKKKGGSKGKSKSKEVVKVKDSDGSKSKVKQSTKVKGDGIKQKSKQSIKSNHPNSQSKVSQSTKVKENGSKQKIRIKQLFKGNNAVAPMPISPIPGPFNPPMGMGDTKVKIKIKEGHRHGGGHRTHRHLRRHKNEESEED